MTTRAATVSHQLPKEQWDQAIANVLALQTAVAAMEARVTALEARIKLATRIIAAGLGAALALLGLDSQTVHRILQALT